METSSQIEATIETPETPSTSDGKTDAPKATACTHHFGYLSERKGKERIPEECITCTEIVNCMLKAVKN